MGSRETGSQAEANCLNLSVAFRPTRDFGNIGGLGQPDHSYGSGTAHAAEGFAWSSHGVLRRISQPAPPNGRKLANIRKRPDRRDRETLAPQEKGRYTTPTSRSKGRYYG
ncbi:hypothetical protein [Sulfitobacter geojensis]|uniref:hypothetical protein n=1 Tax=Sulfitobacter geojensis TaxID=1342299 RepID=UPI000469BD0F|nr:hypothetical protein [Sulfitobacter geojensis]KHA52588.1 hypothetical protein Z947_2896 [Sulfitobacter geojensis]NYI28734.1 hypothetical protein [Sulfitobacter geojensis]